MVGLHAAALDNRIKGVASISGFMPFRGDIGGEGGRGGVERWSKLYQLQPRLGFFIGSEEKIPYDYDDVLGEIVGRGGEVLVYAPLRDRVNSATDVEECVKSVVDEDNNIELVMLDDINSLNDAVHESVNGWLARKTQH